MPKFSRLLQRSRVERQALLEAWVLSGIARLLLFFAPFRRIAPRLGRPMQVATDTHELHVDLSVESLARRVQWAVSAASRHVPWRAACLEQAITARWMLGRRGVAGTIYLGLGKDESGQLAAHAWLRSGGLIVTGEREMDNFTTICTFAFSPSENSFPQSENNSHESDCRHTSSRRQTC